MIGEETFGNLHEVLRNLYNEMMPLCSHITGIATGVAALGALFYVASRVWQALSRAEPIDVYPLFRPFCLGACIMFFPLFVLGTINGIMNPIVTGCHSIMKGQTLNMQEYAEKRQKLEYEAMVRNPETAYLVDDEEYERQIEDLGWSPSDLKSMAGMAMERTKYKIEQSVGNMFRSLLELIFQSVSLILDTLRAFFLIVLSILGPLSFAISVYDGFHNTMIQWIYQYISIYLWLPLSDLFSSVLARIQVLMMEKDIAALTDPNYVPDVNNSAYIIFMLIAIVGYFTIPTVSIWVIQASGAGNYGKQVNSWSLKGGRAAAAATGAAAGHVAGKLRGR
ncbi:MAG: conjugative transposon protein TraJ [Parabacteroides sp.]|nr:conjugative transposon protein TraJ [Parabacteroides sp.]